MIQIALYFLIPHQVTAYISLLCRDGLSLLACRAHAS